APRQGHISTDRRVPVERLAQEAWTERRHGGGANCQGRRHQRDVPYRGGLAHERPEASTSTRLATGHQFRRSITLRQWKRVFIRLTGTCATRSTSSMNRFESA